MTDTQGLVAHGTTLKIAGVTVGELKNIDGLDISAADVDFSNHDNNWDEFKPGRRAISDLSVEGNWIPGNAGQAAMYAAFIAGTIAEFIVTGPDGSYTWTFNAYVKQLKSAQPDGDKVGFSATLKGTGAAVLAVGASADLSGLVPSVGTLTGPLTASIYDYVVPVITGTTGLTITPTGAGVIKVNGVVVVTTEASGTITLGDAGSVTEIIVTAQETGKVLKTYTIWVARAAT